MKHLRLAFILTLTIVLVQACKTSKRTNGNKKNTKNGLIIFQNGVETSVNNLSETIEIDKKEFSLRFYNKKYNPEKNKFYSAQIAAFVDKSEFDKVKVGLAKIDLPCFEPGSGMAPDKSGKYETLIFNNNGHHYTIYENPESERLNLLEDSGKFLKLEFEVNSLYYDTMEVMMTDTKLKEFYIAFLIDRNLNGTIDKGELKKLTFKVKEIDE
ncbi:hypothetical protein J2X69_002942 [Algoriphagus sp. 4150]|uniref:hypothetical protein n=1 Tax=Algoriphagus sp. 4150 TaxID=2817756 RepID=UPI00285C9964|nr:hypothetical protein [Algoriphagus sp. 4150]MDR7130586.1 hypothetical protein [Algoriphagus sp. 4150]